MATQTARLIAYLRSHSGASGLELIAALRLPKYTSRISDARAAGFDVVCVKEGGLNRYYLREKPDISKITDQTVFTFAPAEKWPADLRWDGLFRCVDHAPGFHPSMGEASSCIRGEYQAQPVQQVLFG